MEISKDKVKFLEAVNELADTVLLTMGPNGSTVVITDIYGNPKVTKDGVTVSDNIEFKDHVKNTIAKILKQAARKTLDQAGDGTTTATCLAQAFINKGYELLKTMSFKDIREELNQLEIDVLNALEAMSISKDEVYDVAHIACNSDSDMASIIKDAYDHSLIVRVEESREEEDHLVKVSGMKLNGTIFDKAFINNAKKQAIDYGISKLIIVDGKVEVLDSALKVLLNGEQKEPIIIIADHFSNQVLDVFKDNYNRGALQIGLVKSPGFAGHRRDLISDIVLYTGSKSTTLRKDLYVGQIDKIFADKNQLIISKEGIDVSKKIEELKEAEKIELDEGVRKLIQKRLDNFYGKISFIFVGGDSEIDMMERKDRIDDAVKAVKCALEEGVVEGGGMALARVSFEENILLNKFVSCLLLPHNNIMKTTVVDFETNLLDKKIMDPYKVTRCALQNAISVSKTILSTEAVVLNERLWT